MPRALTRMRGSVRGAGPTRFPTAMELLHTIARYAQVDVDPHIARFDPSHYRLLRSGVTRFHLEGLTQMVPERISHVTGF